MAVPHRNDLFLVGRGKRGRGLTRSIITAGVLAVVAVILGVVGFRQVTVQPTHSITFEVEEGLPYGITQETVEASAVEYEAKSYKPFTMKVVERELTWAETYRGETGDADVLFSVGSGSDLDEEEAAEYPDEDGADTVLPDFNRVAFKGEGSSKDGITESSAVREAFVNNQTLGHGPGAVVGAALTAADVKFGSGNRSVAYWGSFAALPMFLALLVTYAWMKDRRRDRQRARQLSDAQLRLARVVLELDSIEVRFEVAKAAIQDGMSAGDAADTDFKRLVQRKRQARDQGLAKMERQWNEIRSTSLTLAKNEARLEAVFRDRLKPEGSDTLDEAVKDLEAFAKDTESLQRQAAALADASELRVGHAGSQSILDRLAAPLIQAVDDVLHCKRDLPPEYVELNEVRAELLALSLQANSEEAAAGLDTEGDPDEAQSLVKHQSELLKKWAQAEGRLRRISADLEEHLRGQLRSRGRSAEAERSVKKPAEERAQQRILSMTAGKTSTFRELRHTLGLGYGAKTGPQQAVEGVLVVLDRLQRSGPGSIHGQGAVEASNKERFSAAKTTAGLLVPVLVALGLGWVAVAQIPSAKSYGLELTGDKELQALNVYGDVAALPEAEKNPVRDVDQAGSLDADYIRERMRTSLKYSSDRALFPEELALTVAIVPADDYMDYRRNNPESENRMVIDYWEVVEGQRKLKEDVAEEFPEVVDPETGDIARGQGILPIWVLDEQTYAIGYTLTGQISSGLNSRVGAYAFAATEPARHGPGENSNMLIGDRLSYDLGELATAMEYNHMESSDIDPASVFWMTAISAWTGIMTLGVLGAGVLSVFRQRAGNKRVREQLGELRTYLDSLALGLDMTRLDLVAVLGGKQSPTGGDAEESEQRLYEAGLVTAWRELDALEGLPRKLQKGADWNARVDYVRQLVEMLGQRSQDISSRTEQLLRAQRRVASDL
ncbi:MAG: hypothetical protein ACTIJJ_09445 [Galactobacter sp.]